MAYKYNYNIAKKIAYEKGYTLVSEKFESVDKKITLKSKEGFLFMTTLAALKKRYKFNFFDTRNPYTIENIKLWIKLNNKTFELLDNVFINAKHKMEFRCLVCEDEIFLANWNNIKSNKGCRSCSYKLRANQRITLTTNKIVKELETINPNIIVQSEYNGFHKPLLCLCIKHNINWLPTWANLRKGQGCYFCRIEKVQKDNHPFWKGGITPLQNHLRRTIKTWKEDSFKKYSYTCDITGEKLHDNIIHHLVGFNTILYETLEILGLPILNSVNEYSSYEMKLIEDTCIELHYKYGLGVCLSSEMHKEFHKIYGKGSNTPEQYFEFKKLKLNI